MTNIMVPETIDTDSVVHCIMLIIASKVATGETLISLKQGLKEFCVDGENEVLRELDVLHLQTRWTHKRSKRKCPQIANVSQEKAH